MKASKYKQQAVKLLPKVGDKRMERPLEGKKGARECVVTEVNVQGLWYRVRFTETGFHECFKVPELQTIGDANDKKGT